MARPALTTLDELERLTGPIVVADNRARAEVLLEQASEIVRAFAGVTWLNTAEDAVEAVPGSIPGVVTAMVDRATANPGGITQEQAGPFSRSFGSDAAQRLYLTKAEKTVVRAAVGSSGIGTITTSRGPLETRSVTGWHGWFPEETMDGLHTLLGDT